MAVHPDGQVAPCRCLERFRIYVRLAEGGIPQVYHKSRLEDYRYQKMNLESFKRVESYAASLKQRIQEGAGMYFDGLHGVGKTYLMCCVLRVAATKEFTVCFRSLGQLLSEMADAEFGGDAIRQFFECDFLALDEIEKVYKTKAGIQEALFDRLIRTRYGQRKPVMITSNCTPEALESVHGKAIRSLFSETLENIPLVGPDYRERRVR